MLLTLIQKEIRNNLLNMRFMIAFFAVTLLMVGVGAFGVADYIKAKTSYDLSRDLYRNGGDQNDFVRFYFGNLVARQPQLLSVFAMGGERQPDNKATITWILDPQFRSSYKASPLPVLFAPVDIVFIVGVVLSLFVFMLTFDAVSGEREKGMLRLLLASPVPRDAVILGKWLGGYISLMLPFVTSLVLVMLMLVLSPRIHVADAQWLRIGAISLVMVLYLAVVFSLSLFVSTLHKRSGTVALTLLAVWVAMGLLMPGLGAQAAQAVRRPEGVRAREMSMLGALTYSRCVGGRELDSLRREEYERRYGDTDYEKLTKEQRREWDTFMHQTGRQHETREVDSILVIANSWSLDELAVARLSRWMSLLSPFGCLQNACITLAGTGIDHEHLLRTSLAKLCRDNQSWFWDRIGDSGGFRLNEAPLYRQPDDTLGPHSTSLLVDIGVLALMGLLFFMLAYARFTRMDIT